MLRRSARGSGADRRSGILSGMTHGAQTMLVVEDEASIASFVSLYLKNAGYGVRTAANGRRRAGAGRSRASRR